MAQIIAKRHPEVVKGLLLTSTASLSNDLRFEGMECLVRMLNEEKEQKRYRMYKKFPMFLLPVMMNLALMFNTDEFMKIINDFMEAQA